MLNPSTLLWIHSFYQGDILGDITVSFVNDRLVDLFTKSFRGPQRSFICNMLGAYDLIEGEG